MKTPAAALAFALLASSAAAAPVCPRLSALEAQQLTRPNMKAEICRYQKAADAAKASGSVDVMREGLDCILAAGEAEQRFRERFKAPSGCVKLDGDPK